MKAAVFFGGVGPEREVSLASGAAVLDAAGRTCWEPVPVEVTDCGDFTVEGNVLPPAEGAARLSALGVEAAFLALHGPFGEDGAIQGFLKVAGIPFAGPGVESAACAMNKHVSRLLLLHAGVPVPSGTLLRIGRTPPGWEPPLPAVVKPCRLGSSVGVRLAGDREAVEGAVAEVWRMGQDCLVEEYVSGREYSCPVWERRDGPTALPVVEIRPADGRPFFDYRAKYSAGQAEEIVHAVDSPISGELKELALKCHDVLGCRSFSRTDFIVGPRGPVALEVNTIPGLTYNSLLPKALAGAGFSLADLVAESLELARGDGKGDRSGGHA
jgi:D-alanine-D-alanine ligase